METPTSEASIIRTCRKLGYRGFQDLKIHVAKFFVHGTDKIQTGLSSDDSVESILAKNFQGTIDTLNSTLEILDIGEFRRAADALLSAGKIHVFGLGNSASVVQDIAHKFTRAGLTAHAYTDNHYQMIACCSLGPGDVALGVSHSGNSRDIVEALRFSKENGATTVCLTNYGTSPITKSSDIRLFTSSAETKFRQHGMYSRFAQLAIADALFIYASFRRGRDAIDRFDKIDQSLTAKKY